MQEVEPVEVPVEVCRERCKAAFVRPQLRPVLGVTRAVQGVVDYGQQQPEQGEFLGGHVAGDPAQAVGLGEDFPQGQLVLRAVPPQNRDPGPRCQVER